MNNNTKSNKLRQRKNELTEERIEDNAAAKKDSKRKKATIPTSGTRSVTHRMWTRTVLIFSLMAIVYFFSKREKETKFALHRETIPQRFQKIPCSQSYLDEIEKFPKCVPKTCGRLITDTLISTKEADILLDIAKTGIALGGSSGGASILDLHSGALSKDENFISIYKLPEAKSVFKNQHLVNYKLVRSKIMKQISEKFHLDESSLYLTHPTFFSRIDNSTAKTIHDEYWHPHVDKETYSSFHYTSLLYLNDFGKDFSGGRFLFIDGQNEKNRTQSSIEPKRSRLSVFTSGAENLHYVEKVTSGTRYAITISFTCDPAFAIGDPQLKVEDTEV